MATVVRSLAAGVVALAAASGAQAGEPVDDKVDLALVLAVDISKSVEPPRWDIQRQGYAAAFRAPDVIKAITSGAYGAIAVTFVEWSDPSEQYQMVGWTRIDSKEAALQFAEAIESAPRERDDDGTSIAGVIAYGSRLLAGVPYAAERHVIDISGDGKDNEPIHTPVENDKILADARKAAIDQSIVINGLPILGAPHVENLGEYYTDNVIGGRGAFMLEAQSWEDVPETLQQKLVLEVSGRTPATGTRYARR